MPWMANSQPVELHRQWEEKESWGVLESQVVITEALDPDIDRALYLRLSTKVHQRITKYRPDPIPGMLPIPSIHK